MENFIYQLPTPLEVLLDPISLIVYVLFGGLMLWESIFPARKLPKVKYWKLRGLLFFIVYILLTTCIPLTWDGFFASYQLMGLSELDLTTQVFLGIFLFELVQYGCSGLLKIQKTMNMKQGII